MQKSALIGLVAVAGLAAAASAQNNIATTFSADRVTIDQNNPSVTITLLAEVTNPDNAFGLARVAGDIVTSSDNGNVGGTVARTTLSCEDAFGQYCGFPNTDDTRTGTFYPFRGLFNPGFPPGTNDDSAFNGTVNGANITGIDGVQNPLYGVEQESGVGSPANVYRFTFSTDDFTARVLTFSFNGSGAYFVEIDQNGLGRPSDPQEISGEITIQVIPAPATAGLLGLGGLVAARRRRA